MRDDRFLQRALTRLITRYEVDENGCWIWQGSRPQGHEYTPENTGRWGKVGARQCKTCSYARNREYCRTKRIYKSRAKNPEVAA